MHGLVPPPVLVRDIKGNHTNPNSAFELAISKVLGREGVGTDVARVQAKASPLRNKTWSGPWRRLRRKLAIYVYRSLVPILLFNVFPIKPSRMSSELDAARAELDEAIRKASTAKEKSPLDLRPRDTDLDVSEGLFLSWEVSILQEQILVLSSKELKLLVKSKIMRAELETLRVECLQVGLAQGGRTLSSGSISGTHTLVIVEYLRGNIHQRHMKYERLHHSQSGYVKALSDVTLFFLSIDL
ncbi:hypothetical protein ACLOJK_022830 [Asimina triloba]